MRRNSRRHREPRTHHKRIGNMGKIFLRFLLFFLLFLIVFPYLIPVEKNNPIPKKPFENSKFFTTKDQVSLHYRIWEPTINQKGQILLIHGLAGSTFSFRNNVEALANAGYLVVAVDLPAFGYSSRQTGLSHDQVSRAKWIFELLDDIEKNNKTVDKWYLLGHSMGGSTILAMSNLEPERVKSLIMVDAAIVSTQSNRLPFPFTNWLKVILNYFMLNEDTFATFLQQAYGQKPTEDEVTGYVRPLQIKGTNQALVEFVNTSKNVLIEEWEHPDIPMFVLWGKQDTWIPVSDIDKIKDVATNVEVHIFEDAAHCAYETESSFNSVLLEYLSRH